VKALAGLESELGRAFVGLWDAEPVTVNDTVIELVPRD